MEQLQNLFLLTFTVLIVLVTLISKRSSSSKAKSSTKASSVHDLPPGPWKLPIVGNLHQLIVGAEPPHRRFRNMAKKHGPVIQLQLGELPHVIISSAEAAREVLKTHDAALASRPDLLAASIIFYGRQGIVFTPHGDYWRTMRKIATVELLSEKRVRSYRSVREDELSGSLVRRISAAAAAGEVVNLPQALFWASNRVIARSAFGVVQKNTESFFTVVNYMSDLLSGFTVSDFFPSLGFLPTLTGFRARVTRLHREADVLLDEIVNEHITRRRQRQERDDYGQDLLDVLLDIQERNSDLESPLTMEQIKAVATEMYLAGSGTSPTTIEWTMSELMRNPTVMKKVQEEVRQVFDKKGVVEEEGLDDLKYMDAVIKESLRLHSDGPLLAPRESQEDVVIDGYRVPAKTKLLINVWAIARDPKYWTDNAETFYPERFLEDSAADYRGKNFEFIPFGSGRRMCAGVSFGMATVRLVVANLLYHFDWKLPGGMKPEDVDMTERFGLTLRRKSQLCLIPVAYNAVML